MARQLVSKSLAFGDPFANASGGSFAVYDAGIGVNLAQIYDLKTGGGFKSNPFTVGADSLAKFYIEPGLYRFEFQPPTGPLVVIDEYLVLDENLANSPTGELQFADVNDLKNGTPINANQITTSTILNFIGQKVSTVVNNTTSNKGGKDYTIWTRAEYRTAINDPTWEPDGYGDHYLLGGTTYVAIIELYGGPITPEMCGAMGDNDGTVGNGTNDYDAITGMLAFCDSRKCSFQFTSSYRIGTKLVFGTSGLTGSFAAGAKLVPDAALLVPVEIGSASIPSKMEISGLKIDRVSLSTGTENIGINFIECVQCTFTNFESRNSKYNMKWAPQTGAQAYNTFINMQAIAGVYNWWMIPAGSGGYVNENVYIGGRCFAGGSTDTQLRIEKDVGATNNPNNNRFYSPSLEGAGQQAVYMQDADFNLIHYPRTEGSWVVDDIVLDTDAEWNMIESTRIDLSITDNSTNQNNMWTTRSRGSRRENGTTNGRVFEMLRSGLNNVDPVASPGAGAGNPVLLLDEQSTSASSRGVGIIADFGRDEATSYLFVGRRRVDGAVRSYLTANGIQFLNQYMDSRLGYYIGGTSGALGTGASWTAGNGSPEGVVAAPVGSLYSRRDGAASTSLYVKEVGSGNTGWVAK